MGGDAFVSVVPAKAARKRGPYAVCVRVNFRVSSFFRLQTGYGPAFAGRQRSSRERQLKGGCPRGEPLPEGPARRNMTLGISINVEPGCCGRLSTLAGQSTKPGRMTWP